MGRKGRPGTAAPRFVKVERGREIYFLPAVLAEALTSLQTTGLTMAKRCGEGGSGRNQVSGEEQAAEDGEDETRNSSLQPVCIMCSRPRLSLELVDLEALEVVETSTDSLLGEGLSEAGGSESLSDLLGLPLLEDGGGAGVTSDLHDDLGEGETVDVEDLTGNLGSLNEELYTMENEERDLFCLLWFIS